MIDGVKIQVPTATAVLWNNNPLLEFLPFFKAEMYKYEGRFYLAQSKGLHFFIWVKKDTDKVIKCEVRGSLHKFYNNGKHNYNDFTPDKLENTIQELEQNYNIDRHTAIIHNLEIGVNIYIPIPVKKLLLNLVAFKNTELTQMRVGGKGKRRIIGKIIDQQRQVFKVYNKGQEFNLKAQNLARFELAFNKMKGVSDCINVLYKSGVIPAKYEIKTLSDLTNINKISPLIYSLLDKWENIIYYDKSINLRDLTATEQRRILYLATPRNWVEFNRTQRMRAKARFNELMNLHGSTTKKDIGALILEKWHELTAVKCIRINRPQPQTQQPKNVYELTDIIPRYNVYNSPIKENNKKSPKNTPKKSLKKRVCKVCKNDISHKRTGAKYCSKKCNNKHNGKMRTKKRQKQRATEIKNLKKLILLIDKGKMWLMISYKTDNGIYTDTLHQHEIRTTPEWVRSVQKVLVTEYRKKAPPIILTSYRARKLIKLINDKNLKNGEK